MFCQCPKIQIYFKFCKQPQIQLYHMYFERPSPTSLHILWMPADKTLQYVLWMSTARTSWHVCGCQQFQFGCTICNQFSLFDSSIYSLRPLLVLSIIRNRSNHTVFNITVISRVDGKNTWSRLSETSETKLLTALLKRALLTTNLLNGSSALQV